MENQINSCVKEYQCCGCVSCDSPSCFKNADYGIGCGSHRPGTIIMGRGALFLGLPKGFNRLGNQKDLMLTIFETYESGWKYDKFNIATWKHLTENGHTIVRGMSPRINEPFLHVYLENCLDKVNCLEITKEDMEEMD